MEKDKDFLGTEPIGKLLLRLAIPTLAAQLINMLYNVVDRIYIGHIPKVGALALTGVGVCMPLIMIVSAFAVLVGNGGAPRASIYMGQNNKEDAEKTLGNCFAAQILVAIVLTIVLLFGNRTFLLAFGASENTISYAAAYMNIYAVGTIFVQLTLGLNAFITAQGFAKTGMLSVLIGAVINIVLDPIFIFGLHMGVRGAAVATIISQFCSAVWVLRFLCGKKAVLNLKKSAMKISWKRVADIVSLGMSGFFMAFTNSLVQVVCNATLQTWGGDIYVGVMTVLNSVRDIFTMPVHGLTTGASPVMSFNYGEKAYDRIKKAIKFITVVCIVYTMAGWGILKVMPEFFIRIFNSDPELLEKGVPALHIYFFGFCFMALQFTGQSVFVALGKAKKATFFSLFRKAIIVVPLTILLPYMRGLGTDGVFWAEPISNLVGGCACFFTMLATVLPELNGKPGTGEKQTNRQKI